MSFWYVFLGIAVGLAIAFFVRRKPQDFSVKDLFERFENQIKDLRQEIGENLREQRQSLQVNSRDFSDKFHHIGVELKTLAQTAAHLQDSTKELSTIKDVLQNPKLRGSLGELLLSNLLHSILPESAYQEQYRFSNNETVDVAIFLKEKIVPVDSKFPMDSFIRFFKEKDEELNVVLKKDFIKAVKNHINSISQKYILPDEGTLDFAFMYIPAENVYYEIITTHKDEFGDLLQYAQEKKVIPVSPNSFFSYLQTVLMGLKGLQIEQNAQEILEHLGRLRGDFEKFNDKFSVLGKHLSDARSSFEDSQKKLDRFGEKLNKLPAESEVKKLK